MTRASKCPCGCRQGPASTTRLRKAECPACGYIVRLSRECISHGLPRCPCGAELECPCLEDRCHLPGDAGREAWAEYAYRCPTRPDPVYSARAQKAAATRKAHKAWSLIPDATVPIMPF